MPRPHTRTGPRSLRAAGLGAALVACASPPVPPTDAEVGSLGTCAAPRALGALVLGAQASLELGPDAWRFLDHGWGVELEVATPGGAGGEVLVVTARDRDALEAPFVTASGCGDGAPPVDLRATAGGEARVAFAVAGDAVRLQVAVGARDAALSLTVARVASSAPVLDEAVVRVDAQGVEVIARGRDAEGDVARADVQALDAAGAPVAFRGGAGRAVEIPVGAAATPGDFALRGFTPLDTAVGVARAAWVSAVDATGAASARVRAAVHHVERQGLGAACDEGARACARELVCEGACRASDEGIAFCTGAPSAALDPAGTRPVTVALEPDPAGLGASCAPDEVVRGRLAVTLPAEGALDLLVAPASDELALFGLAAREDCGDPASELACASFRDTLELLDVGPRALTVLVALPDVDASTQVTLSLSTRPVLDAGASCDPAERADRCRAGACDALTRRCP